MTWLTEMCKLYGLPTYRKWQTPDTYPDNPSYNFYMYQWGWKEGNGLPSLTSVAIHHRPGRPTYMKPNWHLTISTYDGGRSIQFESQKPITGEEIWGSLQAIGVA